MGAGIEVNGKSYPSGNQGIGTVGTQVIKMQAVDWKHTCSDTPITIYSLKFMTKDIRSTN